MRTIDRDDPGAFSMRSGEAFRIIVSAFAADIAPLSTFLRMTHRAFEQAIAGRESRPDAGDTIHSIHSAAIERRTEGDVRLDPCASCR
jgi:hypothetical protein